MIEKIKTTNPYSGESEMLTPEEHKLYIEIKEAELNEDYKTIYVLQVLTFLIDLNKGLLFLFFLS